MINLDNLFKEYAEWVKESIVNGKAIIERNVEREIYIRDKNSSDTVKTEKRICDVITIVH